MNLDIRHTVLVQLILADARAATATAARIPSRAEEKLLLDKVSGSAFC